MKREGLERDQKDIKERLESQVRQNREKEESVQTSFASLSEATMVAGTVVMADGAPGWGCCYSIVASSLALLATGRGVTEWEQSHTIH